MKIPSDDDDLVGAGRFAGGFVHPNHGDSKPKGSPPSTTFSTRSTTCEEVIQEFLQEELRTYFLNKADANLFLKMLTADGLEPFSRS